jgi:4-carboxymuconolactone decarboxylase
MNKEAIRARYESLFGFVPEGIESRIRLAEAGGHLEAIDAIEEFRRVLINDNPLDPRTQQLVHFAMLIALREAEPARLHAQGALRAGASISDLLGVCETAAVVCGMPGLSLAVEVVTDILVDKPKSEQH